MPVFKATVQVTVLMEAESLQEAERELERLDLEDLYHEMDDGAYVGTFGVQTVAPVPPQAVHAELLAVGNDGTFFQPAALDPESAEEPS